MFPNEAQTRKQLIDGQIKKAGWNLSDFYQVRFEAAASGDDEDWTDGITDLGHKVFNFGTGVQFPYALPKKSI